MSVELDLEQYDNVVALDSPHNFEEYLVHMGYEDEIISAINGHRPVQHENMLSHFCYSTKTDFGQSNSSTCEKCSKAIWQYQDKDFCCADGKRQALIHFMKKNKIEFAVPIAKKISETCIDDRKYPPKVKMLLDKIRNYLEA